MDERVIKGKEGKGTRKQLGRINNEKAANTSILTSSRDTLSSCCLYSILLQRMKAWQSGKREKVKTDLMGEGYKRRGIQEKENGRWMERERQVSERRGEEEELNGPKMRNTEGSEENESGCRMNLMPGMGETHSTQTFDHRFQNPYARICSLWSQYLWLGSTVARFRVLTHLEVDIRADLGAQKRVQIPNTSSSE